MADIAAEGIRVVTLLGFKLASQAPDRGHPFGHGRMEYISGLVVSMIIILMQGVGDRSCVRAQHGEGYAARDGPGNQSGNQDGGIFDIQGELLPVPVGPPPSGGPTAFCAGA